MKTHQRNAIIEALLRDNPRWQDLAHHNPWFRAGLEQAVGLLELTITGLAEVAPSEHERVRQMEDTMRGFFADR